MAMRLFTTSGGSSLAALGNEDGSVNLYDLRRSKPLTNCSIFDEPRMLLIVNFTDQVELVLCLDVDKTGKSFICGSSTHHLVRMHMCYTQVFNSSLIGFTVISKKPLLFKSNAAPKVGLVTYVYGQIKRFLPLVDGIIGM